MLATDKSNSPAARGTSKPIAMIRSTACEPAIVCTVPNVENVLGSSAEKTTITISHTKTTPNRRKMSSGLSRNGDESRFVMRGATRPLATAGSIVGSAWACLGSPPWSPCSVFTRLRRRARVGAVRSCTRAARAVSYHM
jgi:hypothetical protein